MMMPIMVKMLIVVPVVYALMDRLTTRLGFHRAELTPSHESLRANEALEEDTVAGPGQRRSA